MSDFKNKNYDNLYNHFVYGGGYNLDGDAFTEELKADIKEKTGLDNGTLGDWWVFYDDVNAEFTWEQLIKLAVGILNTKATQMFIHNLYLETIPDYKIKAVDKLPSGYVSGAKRVNFSRGEYYDFTGAVGIQGLMNPNRDEILNNPPKANSGDKFRGSGKDESCMVEGTWYDWVCLACNVLSSENTKLMCPDLYEKELKNDHY